MTTTTITPEFIIAGAQAAKLELWPGDYFHKDDDTGKRFGCCAAAAVALTLNPGVSNGLEVCRTLRAAGITNAFQRGLEEGFDALAREDNLAAKPDYAAGFSVGRATRVAIGLDAPGGGAAQ